MDLKRKSRKQLGGWWVIAPTHVPGKKKFLSILMNALQVLLITHHLQSHHSSWVISLEWVWSLLLLLTSCVTLGKSLELHGDVWPLWASCRKKYILSMTVQCPPARATTLSSLLSLTLSAISPQSLSAHPLQHLSHYFEPHLGNFVLVCLPSSLGAEHLCSS